MGISLYTVWKASLVRWILNKMENRLIYASLFKVGQPDLFFIFIVQEWMLLNTQKVRIWEVEELYLWEAGLKKGDLPLSSFPQINKYKEPRRISLFFGNQNLLRTYHLSLIQNLVKMVLIKDCAIQSYMENLLRISPEERTILSRFQYEYDVGIVKGQE